MTCDMHERWQADTFTDFIYSWEKSEKIVKTEKPTKENSTVQKSNKQSKKLNVS